MEEEQGSTSGRPGKRGPMLLVLMLLLGGTLGAGGGWFAAGMSGADAESEGGRAGKVDAPPSWELFALDNVVLNPAGTQGRRFLILSAAIEADPERTLPILEASDARIRDGILRVLGTWGVEELVDAGRRAQVEEVVREVVLDIVGGAPVGRIYFSQFVLQ